MLEKLKKIISNTCICFTVIEFLLLIISEYMLSTGQVSDTVVSFLGLRPAAFVWLAALIFNLLSYVLNIKSLPGAVTRIIHYALSMLCVLIICVIIPQSTQSRFIFVLLALATLIYLILWLFSFIFSKIFSKERKCDEPYSPVFDKSETDSERMD